MLGAIRAGLEAKLRARGVPTRVEYGPVEPARLLELRDVVVVEHDPAGDSLGGPRSVGPKRNPRVRFVRAVGVVVRVFAASTKDGARRQEHEDRLHLLLDQVQVALDDVLRGDGHWVWRQTRAAFESLEVGRTGAEYAMHLEVERSVVDTPWDQSAVPIGTIAGINSTTKVYGQTGEGAGETSCAP